MKLSFRKFKQIVPHIWVNRFFLAALISLNIYGKIGAELMCHQCHGINCLRTTYNATQKCINNLDICVNVFDGQTVVAQGCLEELSEELREKCYNSIETDNQDSARLSECFKCNENLCNNLGSESFECVQCDSNSDANCYSKAETLTPSRCLVSRTPNEYCFAKLEGKAIVRGCLYSLEEQLKCSSSEDCMICQASEISACNSVPMSVNDSESSGSGNDNGSSGSGEGGSNQGGSGDGGTNGSDNNGSDSKPGGDGSGSSGGGSEGNEGSDSGSSGSGNDDSSSQGGSSESGGGSNGSSLTIAIPYIYILLLSVCNSYVFAKK